MSFSKTKDRVWVSYNVFAGWLANRSLFVRKLFYGFFGLVLWIAYILPGNLVRPTFDALSQHVGTKGSKTLFAGFVRGFCRGINRIEQVRHGHVGAIDAMLRIPEKERLSKAVESGGAILAIPHTHASLAMGRGLAQHFPLLAIVRSGGNKRRAASELEIYENLGCDYLDIRVDGPTVMARRVLKALGDGKLVVGTVDRIREAPAADDPIDRASDTVRATAFGQPIGVSGWPARFAHKAKVPIIPATIVQTDETITLCLGESTIPTDDLVASTQTWISELEQLFRSHPEEWIFALDKHWSKALRAQSSDKAS